MGVALDRSIARWPRGNRLHLGGPGTGLGIVFIALGILSGLALVAWTRDRAFKPEPGDKEPYLTKSATSELYRLLLYDPVGCLGFNLPLYLVLLPVVPFVFWKPLREKRSVFMNVIWWWIITWLTIGTGVLLIL